MNIIEFYELLESHNWKYDRCDSREVYIKGKEKENKIKKIVESDRQKFEMLYNEYRNYIFNNGEKPLKE